ncbi:MAG: aminotransferase class I/II-fold pyridoxal phosphate-dependent enzyme [Acidobacteria bacterium]|jgi:aspartate/methionine/tyrosine aminotransferase|nr:aminotransferase class I/II-fold pyridoxal phosphate-dependent enzyme [Acidobacteriota bacterium]
MTEFQPFVMERMMSKWENVVDVNLSESGVHPMTLGELLEMGGLELDAVADVPINYPQANGTIELRETIAAMYPGATADDVLVTVGAAEANYLALTTLLQPGDEAVIMLPNYMQVWGIAKNRGITVRECHLSEERGWALDLAELDAAATPKTKLIAVCNPNNPTGRIMTNPEMDAVVATAERAGAWLLADEVYRGAERETDEETPSFYGRYDKVLAQGSMSKAYGLPGLRIGWSVGPAQTLDDMWARHEYTTISTTALSNRLTALALSEKVRPQILARTRRYIREGFPVLEEWMKGHGDMFQIVPPQAAAIAFARYRIGTNSTELVNRLKDEQSVLIVPGDHFGLDGHLRISYGLPHDYLRDGLDRIHQALVELEAAGA